MQLSVSTEVGSKMSHTKTCSSRQCMSVFFPDYAFSRPSHQQVIDEAFTRIMTIVLNGACLTKCACTPSPVILSMLSFFHLGIRCRPQQSMSMPAILICVNILGRPRH